MPQKKGGTSGNPSSNEDFSNIFLISSMSAPYIHARLAQSAVSICHQQEGACLKKMPSIYPDSGPRASSFVCMVTQINRRDRILWRYLFVWAYPVDRVWARSTICPITIYLSCGWATMCREETRGDLWLLRSTMRLGSESRRGSVWYGWRKKKRC